MTVVSYDVAVIDVAGFTASTLDLRNEDFLNGGGLAFQGASQAALLNLGSVSAFDGDVFLVASSVVNEGSLRAPKGTVGLAAGNDVLIKESGTERVFVRGASGDRKENGVLNRGTVEANVAELKSYGGNIYGMAVKNEGRVAATAATLAMLLRQDEHRGAITPALLKELGGELDAARNAELVSVLQAALATLAKVEPDAAAGGGDGGPGGDGLAGR